MVEPRWIGGSCPQHRMSSRRNIIHSAKVTSFFARAAEFGIESRGYAVDIAAVAGRKHRKW